MKYICFKSKAIEEIAFPIEKWGKFHLSAFSLMDDGSCNIKLSPTFRISLFSAFLMSVFVAKLGMRCGLENE